MIKFDDHSSKPSPIQNDKIHDCSPNFSPRDKTESSADFLALRQNKTCLQLNSAFLSNSRLAQSCNTSALTVQTHERSPLDFSIFAQDTLSSVRGAPTPNCSFKSARLSCWLSRLRCVDARHGERLRENRTGFLSNPRALDSSVRASER